MLGRAYMPGPMLVILAMCLLAAFVRGQPILDGRADLQGEMLAGHRSNDPMLKARRRGMAGAKEAAIASAKAQEQRNAAATDRELASNSNNNNKNDANANFIAVPGPVRNLRIGVGINTLDPFLGQMELYWDAPEVIDPFIGPALAYRIYVDGRLIGTVTSIDAFIRHLKVGQRYTWTVTGVNNFGEGPPVSISEAFQRLPGAPRFVQAVPSDRAVDLFWEKPYDEGGTPVNRYIAVNPDPPGPITLNNLFEFMNGRPTSPNSCRFDNLINGELYEMTVRAAKNTTKRNYGGVWLRLFYDAFGAPSGATWAVPHPLPSGPIRFRVIAGGPKTATLAWEPPLDVEPGFPVLGYQINWWEEFGLGVPEREYLVYPLFTTVPATQRTFTVPGLIPGNIYSFSIQAYTSKGVGGMTVFPLGVPGGDYLGLGLPQEPENVFVNGLGAGVMDVWWAPPLPDGGDPPLHYEIKFVPTGQSARFQNNVRYFNCSAIKPYGKPECVGNFLCAGLDLGVEYDVRVRAQNTFGWGEWSKAYNLPPTPTLESDVQEPYP